MKKYIVNNLPTQTISGNITLDGSLNETSVYRALLTKTPVLTGTDIEDFNYGLIIGETYEITNFQSGDDFSNVADVQTGTINQTGCIFIATGELPINWDNGSELTSSGNLAVTVLENNLGFDIEWINFIPGGYVGVNTTTGPIYNAFPRNNVSINVANTIPFFSLPTSGINYNITTGFSGGLSSKDEAVFVVSVENGGALELDNGLYYTPVEIKFKKDLNTTSTLVSGTIVDSFPFNYASVNLFAGDNNVETFYTESSETVSNILELVTLLNNNSTTNYLGTFVKDGMNIVLYIPTNLKNQFSLNNELTFEVFAD